jgi:ABC-type Fe3+/spermidine/putrescine transport system ATPase subunit
MLAGFESPTMGEIYIDGEPMSASPPHERPVNMVFQNYAIFPHLDVRGNIAYGMRKSGLSKPALDARVEEMLDLIKLPGYGTRGANELSGGERQRVALARALIKQPKVLLLDEPLGALDKKLREEMQLELRALQRSVGITFVFVTHDQEEALTLSDRIAIIDQGRLVQVGAPNDVYERPETAFAARFLGDANFMSGTAGANGVVTTTAFGPIRTADSLPDGGATVMLAVRPEKMRLVESSDDGGDNRISGTIRQTVFSGNSVTYILAAGDETIRVFAQNRGDAVFGVGDAVTVLWSARHSVTVRP